MSDTPIPETSAPETIASTTAGPAPLPLNDFGGSQSATATIDPDTSADLAAIGLLDDVELEVKIELGRAQMYIEDVLRLGVGSVIELDKLAGDPVDVYINDRLVARGEVLVLNENLCVRINEIVNSVQEADQTR
jgi:flagellar motor switch protein FliN/FliY